MSPFSIEVGKAYAVELVQTLVRCPMNEMARRSEVRDFARLAIECYRNNKQDWTKGSRICAMQ